MTFMLRYNKRSGHKCWLQTKCKLHKPKLGLVNTYPGIFEKGDSFLSLAFRSKVKQSKGKERKGKERKGKERKLINFVPWNGHLQEPISNKCK